MSDRIVFTTDALPERDRFAIWRDTVLSSHARCEITAQDQSRFRATFKLRNVGAIVVAQNFTSAVNIVRTTNLLGDCDDDTLAVTLVSSGDGYHTQRDNDQKLAPGDGVIFDCAHTGGLSFTTEAQRWLVKIPRQRLASLLPGVKRFIGAALDRDITARHLLFHYLEASLDANLDFVGSAARLYELHIIGLVALALGAEGEARHVIEHDNDVRAVRRAAILQDIGALLSDPKLAAPAVAARLGITPRYLRKLLEETGKSFSEHLLDKRLERAAALLREPDQRDARIAGIAYACGFGDLSYFNRAFRRRYGLTPSDMRSTALGETP
jgi:AraC-like DNA-binding protein